METIISWLMSKFGLAAVVAVLGALGVGYQAVKSKIDIQRERISRQAAEMSAQAAKTQADVERQKRGQAEHAAEVERRRATDLNKRLKTERAQKKREEEINDQESSDLVSNGLDTMFDVPGSGLSGGDTGSDSTAKD